jgi:alpha-mannosidase
MRLLCLVVTCTFASTLPIFSQHQHPPQSSPIERFIADSSSTLINGFGEAISGETIDYHSANERARSALLVRTTDGKMSIVWHTGQVHEAEGKSFVTFCWLAGIAGSKGVHSFALFVNDKLRYRFLTPKDSAEYSWTMDGEGRGSLTFVATEADRFKDLFGYMFMKVPISSIKEGEPLTVRVVGEAAGNSCWYMTFQHPLGWTVHTEALPVLVDQHDTLYQQVRLSMEHYRGPVDVTVYVDSTKRTVQRLTWGVNTILLPVRPVTKPETLMVTIEKAGESTEQQIVQLKPVRRRQLYLLPHSHTDIGYSDHQTVVEKNHMRYIDDAIAIASRTSGYPAGARFKWNIEVLWPLESYVNQASAVQLDRLVEAIKRGWLGLNALYANELTGLCRPEELLQLTQYARTFSRQHGVPITSAMITDIPGYVSSIVTALGESEVKYFSSGPNYVPSLPDGGDRIGYALKAWGDRPFYWKSSSGQHKVLFWMAGKGYSWFHGWIMGRLKDANLSAIFGYLDDLDSTGYPYDMVQLRYSVDGDNGPPDQDLSDFVRDWNARYASPRFVIATTAEMFEEFERRYGKDLPTFAGDLTPYWEDGAASTAAELSLNRSSAETLVQAEALYSIFDPRKVPADQFSAAWRDVVLFDEHTWGAWNSISDPENPSVVAQWEYKKELVNHGDRRASALLARAMNWRESPRTELVSLDIVNTSSWPRTDLVVLPGEISVIGSRVKDQRGAPVPSQRLSTGELAVLVGNVPPLGGVRLYFDKGAPYTVARAVTAGETSMDNGSLSLVLDQKNGSIAHLKWRNQGIDLVDSSRGAGLNEYIYVPGRDPRTAVYDTAVRITVKERGPIVASLVIESRPPGCRSLRREVRMMAGIDRIDIINTLDKKSVREKEGVHFGFPVHVADGVVRLDEGWEIVRPEIDQLRGSCKDFFTVQRWVDVSNSDHGLTWATVDAPLVEVGSLTDETLANHGVRVWKERLAPAQNFYSYALNNYWHTNYKADQEGPVTLRYAIVPHGNFDRASAMRFGLERSQPLLVMPARTSRPVAPFITISPSSVIVTMLKPSIDGSGWIVRLFNAADTSAETTLVSREGRRMKMYLSNLFEDRRSSFRFPLTIPASGLITLRIETE